MFLTFTGVDSRTDLNRLKDISSRYPVEWGFLYSPTRTDPRYTGMPLLTEDLSDLRTSLHLCGAAARSAIKSRTLPYFSTDRVQVNLRSKDYNMEALATLGRHRPIVMQTRDTQRWPLCPPNVYPLLDCSGGRGTALTAWPDTPPATPVGYAGGFGPGKVRPFIDQLPPHSFWIDMETGVRTDDWFDLDKCEQVCREVFDT